MAESSKLKLPGNFSPGKTYLIKGETLIAWREALLADRIIPGAGLAESTGPGGRTLRVTVKPGGATGVPGAFSRVYTNEDGHTMLQGGMVYGGTGAPIEVPDYQLLASGGTPPADGTHVRIDIDVTANEDDEVIVPGCEVDSASISNGTPTATTTPEDGSPGGSISLSLGMWMEDEFQPSGLSGNILVIHYLGTLKIERA